MKKKFISLFAIAVVAIASIIFFSFMPDYNDIEVSENTKYVYQDVDEEIEEDTTKYLIIDQMPVFPGGDEALCKYLAQSVEYPLLAQIAGVQGRVFVSFVVTHEGYVARVKVVNPVHPLLDAEAVRVVQSMPKWLPGKHHGKAVNVSYTLPINFVL